MRGKMETKSQGVNNPTHYDYSIKPIDAIESWGLNFNLGNTIKYIARHSRKGNPEKDLEKALWYLTRELSRVKAEDERETR